MFDTFFNSNLLIIYYRLRIIYKSKDIMKIKKSPVFRISLSELEQKGKHQAIPTTKTMKNLF